MGNQSVPGVRVPLVDEAEASGETADLYDRIKKTTNLPFVPDMFRLVSTRPDLLEVVLAGYTGVFGDGVLPRATREMISAWSSKINGCPYCVGTHNWFLTQFGGSAELTRAIASANEPEELPVDARTLALMQLVTHVSRAAYKVTDEEWARVAAAGWSDEEMLEAVFTAALFAFINRLVDGLGLGSSVAHSRISQQPDVDAEGVA
ncbi:carboxymuconolactone decarboxylase family protein [Streptomyces sp. NPDC058872]|uniref:carboxymuconolactone decarboxylase family protein n=1 Tax=Streptomyces sp. NPDC058872 TaxID=3346661 RepID=UPI0036965945